MLSVPQVTVSCPRRIFPLLRKIIATTLGLTILIGIVSGCVTESGTSTGLAPDGSDVAATARALAEKSAVQPVIYENAAQQGPPLVVLPGQFKLTNSVFAQKFTPNNIADFAEIELEKANFKVLERAHLGPLLDEVTLAVNMGDPGGLKRFRKGKFVTTRWFIQFDVLKAEPVAEAGTDFDGKALGSLITTLAGDNIGGRAAGGIVSSVGGSEDAKVWIVGLRYKILDAASSAIVKSGYVEDKMEVGGSSTTFLGISQTEHSAMSMDSMVQRLVQKCVAEIDRAKGASSAVAVDRQQIDPGSPAYAATAGPDYGQALTEKDAGTVSEMRDLAGLRSRESMRTGEQLDDSSLACRELRKNWQLGDASVMQQYLKECAK